MMMENQSGRHNSLRPDENDYKQSLIFKDGSSDGSSVRFDADVFMKKLTVMLTRDAKKTVNRSVSILNEQEPIMNMSANVKQVFVKISTQLEEPSHPLRRIIKSFTTQFIKDTKNQYFALAPNVQRKISLKKQGV